jgi:hypothetical protein
MGTPEQSATPSVPDRPLNPGQPSPGQAAGSEAYRGQAGRYDRRTDAFRRWRELVVEQLNISRSREVCRVSGTHTSIPPPRKSPPRRALVRDAVEAMLAEDLAAPRKQRHTAKRIFERLRAEQDTQVSYSYVAKFVHRRRPQLAAEAAARDAARAGVVAGFVPQCHPPGAEAEVDFCDLWVRLAGEMTKCFLFTLRLSHSGKAVHRVFASQGQEAFPGRARGRVRRPGWGAVRQDPL